MRKIAVKGLNWIGDAVMSSPFFKSLKNGIPDSEITVIARSSTAEVYKCNPYIDKVIEINEKKNFFSAVSQLKKYEFDEGILLPKSLTSALFFYLSGIKKLSGFKTQYRGLILKNKIELSNDILQKHQVHLYLELAEKCGGNELSEIKLIFETSDEIDFSVEKKWLPQNKKYIGINHGAAFGPAKKWLPEYFAKVINHFAGCYNFTPVIFGSANERDTADEIIRRISGNIEIVDLCGKMNIRELFSCIKKCSLFITNDSGPMHIAAALNIPTTAIFGSTNHIKTGPFSGNSTSVYLNMPCAPCIKRNCRFGTYQCMLDIKPEKVIDAAEKLLKSNVL